MGLRRHTWYIHVYTLELEILLARHSLYALPFATCFLLAFFLALCFSFPSRVCTLLLFHPLFGKCRGTCGGRPELTLAKVSVITLDYLVWLAINLSVVQVRVYVYSGSICNSRLAFIRTESIRENPSLTIPYSFNPWRLLFPKKRVWEAGEWHKSDPTNGLVT